MAVFLCKKVITHTLNAVMNDFHDTPSLSLVHTTYSSYAIHQNFNPPDASSPQCVYVVKCAVLSQLTFSKTSGHLFMSQPVTHSLKSCHQPATINRFQVISHCQYSSSSSFWPESHFLSLQTSASLKRNSNPLPFSPFWFINREATSFFVFCFDLAVNGQVKIT